jgi:hypothetical protein
MNIVDKIMDYESGNLHGFDVLEMYADLIKTVNILHLQGTYQRQARSFIEDGIINQSGEIIDTDILNAFKSESNH